MSRVLNNPADIADWRRRLFNLDNDFLLTPVDFNELWPYVSNFWVRYRTGKCLRTASDTRWEREDQYKCRLYRKQANTQGNGVRERGIRVAVECGMSLRIIEQFNAHRELEVVLIQRSGSCTQHNHTLEYVDKVKRNEKLMEVAGREVSNGYSFAAVTKMLKASQRPDAERDLHNAGGKHLTRQDVKNAGSKWKKANPDPRIVGKSFPIRVQRMECMEWLEKQPGRNPY
jgi:hypothetical protein